MPEPDTAIAVTREWVAKAENDLSAAVHLLQLRVEQHTEAVC